MSDSSRLPRALVFTALVCAAITVVLGATGLAHAVPSGSRLDRAKLAFEAVGLLFLQSPQLQEVPSPDNWAFWGARWFATAWALMGLAGIVLQASRPVRDALRRSAFRLSTRPAAMVIGLGAVGGPIARQIRAEGRPVFGVATEPDGPSASLARRTGVLVVEGDATLKSVRDEAGLTCVREAFIATGRDARNLEIAGGLLADITADQLPRRHPIRCYVHIASPTFSTALSSQRILRPRRTDITFHVFNVQEQEVRDGLLRTDRGILRHRTTTATMHFILLGFGLHGQTMALQLARLTHLKSFKRLRLTIIDDFAGEQRRFVERHPGFCPDPKSFDLLTHAALADPNKDGWASRAWRPSDAAWQSADTHVVEYAANAEFIDVPMSSGAPRGARAPLLQRLSPISGHDTGVEHTLIVGFDDEQRTFEATLWLRDLLESEWLDQGRASKVPLYAYLPSQGGLASWLKASPEFLHSAAVDVRYYGGWAQSESYARVVQPRIVEMAKVVQRHYDPTTPFDELAPAFQASNIDVAAHADIKLDAIGCRRQPRVGTLEPSTFVLSSDQIEDLAHMEHNRWMAERLTSGWRFGEKRSVTTGPVTHENRRRPSMVPWEYLSQAQKSEREKDVAQIAALDEMYAAVGDVIVPAGAKRRS